MPNILLLSIFSLIFVAAGMWVRMALVATAIETTVAYIIVAICLAITAVMILRDPGATKNDSA